MRPLPGRLNSPLEVPLILCTGLVSVGLVPLARFATTPTAQPETSEWLLQRKFQVQLELWSASMMVSPALSVYSLLFGSPLRHLDAKVWGVNFTSYLESPDKPASVMFFTGKAGVGTLSLRVAALDAA